MTKDEYSQQKADIIAKLGMPERDFDQTPLNESAIQLKKLKTAYMLSLRSAKKQADKDAGQSQSPDTLAEFVKAVPSEKLRQAMNKALPPIFLEAHDLKGFTELEGNIVQAHFEDRSLNNEQLANRFGIKRQTVTALFNSREFKLLKLKYFELEAPEATRLAILHLLHDNDQKTAHRLAEHYGIIKAEKTDINITSKPIDDPEALKMLRELGDKLSGKDD